MIGHFLAQATTTVGPGWSQAIQKALQSILSTASLSGWVNKALVMSQFVGLIIIIPTMGRKFMKCKDDQSDMGRVLMVFVLSLIVMGMPRMVVGVFNRATQAITPSEWKVNWQTDGTFQRPKIMTDMSEKVAQAINPKGTNAGGTGTSAHSAWVGWVPGLTKVLDGVDSIDPKYWIGFALSALVQFFADSALFVLGVLYLVMALVMEINLLLFPLMVAFWHTEWFGGVAREFFKHALAVFLWPLGWGVGVLSAEGVLGGITNFSPTLAGLIGFTLSLFLVCFSLCFASLAGPFFFHKSITSGASLGQPLMAGGLGAAGATALNGAGSLASGLIGGLGKAISGLGGVLAKRIQRNSGSGGSGGGRRGEGGGEGGGEEGSGGGSEGSGGGETRGNSLGKGLANDPLMRELEGGLSGSSGRSSGASSRTGGRRARGGGGGKGAFSSGGGGTDGAANDDDGEQSQDSGAESPSILARVRQAAAFGVEMASSGMGKSIGAAGRGVKRAAANAAVKLDRISDAYSEVGGGNASVFKGNNRGLTRHAESLQPGGGGRGGNPGGDDDDGAGDEGSGDEGGASPNGRWRSRGRVEKRPAKRTGRRLPDDR